MTTARMKGLVVMTRTFRPGARLQPSFHSTAWRNLARPPPPIVDNPAHCSIIFMKLIAKLRRLASFVHIGPLASDREFAAHLFRAGYICELPHCIT